MDLPVKVEELQALLAHEKAFTRPFGFRVESIGDGICTLEIPFRREWQRPGGIVSGIVFMTAADVAMWLAIKTQSGLDDTSVTSHMQTSFLQSARGEDFICMAKVLRAGRRTTYGEASCLAKDGKLLTHHTLTYVRPKGLRTALESSGGPLASSAPSRLSDAGSRGVL